MKHMLVSGLVVCLALTACGGKATPDPTAVAQAVAATLTAQVPTMTPSPTGTRIPTATPTPTDTPSPTATPTPAFETMVDWEDYADDNFGFSLLYPSTWRVEERERKANSLNVHFLSEDSVFDVQVLVSTDPDPSESAVAVADKLLANTLEDYEILQSKPCTVGGMEGKAVTFIMPVGPEKVEITAYLSAIYHRANRRLYFFKFLGPSLERDFPIVEAILASIEFTMPSQMSLHDYTQLVEEMISEVVKLYRPIVEITERTREIAERARARDVDGVCAIMCAPILYDASAFLQRVASAVPPPEYALYHQYSVLFFQEYQALYDDMVRFCETPNQAYLVSVSQHTEAMRMYGTLIQQEGERVKQELLRGLGQ